MKYIITTLACLFVSIIGLGQNTQFSKLDRFFTTLEENERYFGSVAVSREGEIIYTKAIGYADLEQKIPNTDETKFRIGSISKTFTATLIMKAVEMGKISLDEKIDTYFPQIKNASKISIRHLLNHRSGINTFTDRSFFAWHLEPISKAALLDTIVSKGIGFEPDAKHVYSNSNYVLLSFLLESIFNKSYADILEQYISKPLALKHTSYGGEINPAKGEARSYRMKDAWTLSSEQDMSIPQGAGGIISTPTDLAHFADALFGGELLSAQSLAQMKPLADASYGLGIEEAKIDEMAGWGHTGAIDAFSSSLTYFEESDISIALICNGSNYGSHDVAIAVLREVFDKPYELPSFEFVELSSEELDQYVGTYESDKLPMDMTISTDGSTLSLGIPGQASDVLKAEGNHKFSILKYGVKVRFIPEQKMMHFEQQGMAFELSMKSAAKASTSSTPIKVDLDQYLGTYTSDQLPLDITFSKEEGKLIAQGTGQPSFPLTAEGEHVFSNEEIGLLITFIPEEKKMRFVQAGAEFEMKLEE